MFNILSLVGGSGDDDVSSERKNSSRTPERSRDYNSSTLSSSGVRNVVTSPHRSNAYKQMYSNKNNELAKQTGNNTMPRKPVLEQFQDEEDFFAETGSKEDPFRADDTEPLASQLLVFLNDCEKSQCLDTEKYINKAHNVVLREMAKASIAVTQYYNISSSFIYPAINPYSLKVLPLHLQFKNEDMKELQEKKVTLSDITLQIVEFLQPHQVWREVLPEEQYHLDTVQYKMKQLYSSQCRNIGEKFIAYKECEKPDFDARIQEQSTGNYTELGLIWFLLRIYKIDSIYSSIASSKLVSERKHVENVELEQQQVSKQQWLYALEQQNVALEDKKVHNECGMRIYDSSWPGVQAPAEVLLSEDEQALRHRKHTQDVKLIEHAKVREGLLNSNNSFVQEDADEHVVAAQKVTDEVAEMTGVLGHKVGNLSQLLKSDGNVQDVLDDVIEHNITSLTTSNTKLGVLLRSGTCDMFSNIIYCAIVTVVFFFMLQYITFMPKPKWW